MHKNDKEYKRIANWDQKANPSIESNTSRPTNGTSRLKRDPKGLSQKKKNDTFMGSEMLALKKYKPIMNTNNQLSSI